MQALREDGEVITPQRQHRLHRLIGVSTDALASLAAGKPPPLREARRAADKAYLMSVLKFCNWNIAHAARVAACDRPSFYRLMRRHDIKGTYILNSLEPK